VILRVCCFNSGKDRLQGQLKKIFDCHVHLSEDPRDLLRAFAKINGFVYDLDELLSLMEENDVVTGLLLSPPLDNGFPLPNENILSLCHRSKDKLLPVLTLQEPTENSVEECLRLARKYKGEIRAFKILLGYQPIYPDAEIFSKLYDYAEENVLAVMFHTGDTATSSGSLKHSHPLNLDALANHHPELRIVICHFGNPWIFDTAELIYKHPNVYADISGLFVGSSGYSRKYLRSLTQRLSEAIYFVGSSEKVIFGTDYPIETFADAIDLTRSLDVSKEEVDKILGENAKKLFSL
jgi:uncharacterized protein